MTTGLSFRDDTAEQLRTSGARFAVTGASGWLGRATLEMLSAALGGEFHRRVSAYGSYRRDMRLSDGQSVSIEPMGQAIPPDAGDGILIFHYAFLTKDKVSALSEEEYFRKNREIRGWVRSWLDQLPVLGLLVASSGAVYDYRSGSARDAAANPYGQLKAEDEEQFAKACAQIRAPLAMPRIFNVSGPFINKFKAYALASIIVDVLEGGPIRLTARQPVLRSYVYVGDVIELCLRWLLNATKGSQLVFDTAGAEIVEIGYLARRIRAALRMEDTPIERPELTSAMENRYVGDGAVMARLAEEYGYTMIGLDEQIRRTTAYIRENLQNGRR